MIRRFWILTLAAGACALTASLALAPPFSLPAPGVAETTYGEARSARSSAPGGVLGTARVLEWLGFAVATHDGVAPPRAGSVWFLLQPRFAPQPEETAVALTWLEAGGRLVYAPSYAGDLLASALRVRGARVAELESVDAYEVGAGRVVVLRDGGYCLSNVGLEDQGLAWSGAWLGWITQDASRVVFDEGRALAEHQGLLARLRERLGPAFWLMLAALVVWSWAQSYRARPAVTARAPGPEDFGEHLRAAARLLRQGRRRRLVERVLAHRPLRTDLGFVGGGALRAPRGESS